MSKNKRQNKKGRIKPIGDVTINDYANSSVCTNRPKKSQNSVTNVIKKLEVEKTWDERDEEDIEADFAFLGLAKSSPKNNTNSEIYNRQRQGSTGKTYPVDIWFLVSEYIRPEDVSNFARICKASLEVVQSATFWYRLYRRHYHSVPSLPERLKPCSLMRLFGLRSSVIRSLFYTYPPFVNRYKSLRSLEMHPDMLLWRRCDLMWTEERGSNWIYCFKLKRTDSNGHVSYRVENNNCSPNLLDLLDDIYANPDENCRLLQVTSESFRHIPLVMGLTLTSATLSLSGQYSHHVLKLNFSTGVKSYSSKALGGSNSVSVVLDPVLNWRILDWWHPQYPHTNNIDYLLKLK